VRLAVAGTAAPGYKMMLRGLIAFCLLAALALVPAGCGGGSAGRGLSYRQQVARAQKEPLPDVRAKKLIKIGYGQAKAKDGLGAEDTMKLAAKACEDVTDPVARAGVFSLLAEARAGIGNRSEARRALQSALAAAGQLEEVETKADTLARVAQAQGALKDTAGAAATLKRAQELAGQLKDVYGKTRVLGAVAAGYKEIGRQAEADRVIGAALELAETIEDKRNRSDAIAEIAQAQSKMDEKEASAETFEAALESVPV